MPAVKHSVICQMHFFSHVATDSWYVMIWAEMGIVGLTLHLFILFYVIGMASF
jgi:hypothetical protein